MSAMLDLSEPPAPGAGLEFLERLRRRAFSCHERGELKAAESAYQRILERSPADMEVRRALGAVALQTGQFGWALQLLSQVAEFADTADIQAQMGLALCGLSRLGDALRCYERAIAAQFDHMPARVNRAQVLHALGRREEAAHAYARTIELGFENAAVHTLHGITLGDLGRAEESVACFERALALEPSYLPAHVNLAIQLRKPAAAATLVDLATNTQQVISPPVRAPALHGLDWPVLLTGAAPTAAILILSALLGSELAKAAMALLAWESPAVVTTPATAAVRGSRSSFDVQPIVNAHLFGQVPQRQDPAMATPAKADLKLTGTLATDNPRNGMAIIREQGKSHAYAVGESVDGASLWQVYKDHVILERDGSYESLYLPRGR